MRGRGGTPRQHLYGVHPISEALRAGRRRVARLWLLPAGKGQDRRAELEALARRGGVPVESAPRDRLDRLAGTPEHQGAVAEVDAYPYEDEAELLRRLGNLGEPPLLLALDGIQDPRNLGALVRGANIAGAHGVIIPKDRAAELTPAAAKASAGAVEHTSVARVTNLVRTLTDLKKAGLWVVGASAEGSTPLTWLRGGEPMVLVIGAEGRGLRPLVRKTCDLEVAIPVRGAIASLNAAMAGAILLHEARRPTGG